MSEFDMAIRGGTVIDGTGREPFVADIAIKDGVIARIGTHIAKAAEEIDATHMIVTPGFIDAHTHYDGQITWENRLKPSSNHGVTTVVMGNCGVGFAPARLNDHELVIKLMEGVEDIPDVVMAEGVPWNWESFPEYLDALAQRESDIDFAAQIPHSPLRVYAMGERGAALEPATDDDLLVMRKLVTEAIGAGAIGVSTSRNLFHRFRDGRPAPSVKATSDEFLALAQGLKDAGAGVFQIIPFVEGDPQEEIDLFRKITDTSGRPLNFSLVDMPGRPDCWEQYVRGTNQLNADGKQVFAHFMPRPIGILFGLDLSFHPFSLNPSYRPLADLPLQDKVSRLRDPDLRARILSEQPDDPNPGFVNLVNMISSLYVLPDPAEYHFAAAESLTERAARMGKDLRELIYDTLLEDEGRTILCCYTSQVATYLERSIGLISRHDMVISLGDGGAHYGMICDAAYPTYVLTELRKKCGLDTTALIEAMTSRAAASVGLLDRGVVAPGYKADINIIDLDRLMLRRPEVRRNLPAGGKRLSQQSEGYVATLVNGIVTYRAGKPTGALPGRLVRGAQSAPA